MVIRSLGILVTVCWLVVPRLAAADSSAERGAAPVADAAERQDGKRVRLLLEQGADVDAAQPDGATALHWAAYLDDLETARRLIAAGANVRLANHYGVKPLSLACVTGNGALVRLLLDAGADPNTALPGGETALMTAARTGKLEPVNWLLARGAQVNAKEQHGQTALMWAAAEGHADVVQALVEAGADFQTPLPSGFTPLLFAAREGRTEVVKVLLRAGAEVNQATRPERSASRAPAPGTSPLILAVENGHFELAVVLLDAGADPDDQRSGFTPLHTVTWVRKPNRGDGEDGDPPPTGSGNLDSLDLVRALVAQGADVNARLERGRSGPGVFALRGATPLLMAAMTADVPLMQTLVELGADPQIQNAEHATLLMAAAGLGTLAPGEVAGTEPEALEAVRLAMEWGADVNAVDDNGETAMHGAAYKSFPAVVQYLAEHGANIDVWNRPNKHGWTPLLIAEGYRPGNFKPSADTVAAIHAAMQAAGVTPPPPTRRQVDEGEQKYDKEGRRGPD